MLIFVDESGDPGLKTDKGSTFYLVVSLIFFEDRQKAQHVNYRITRLRNELGLPSNYEFKFYSSSERVRRKFLIAVAPYEFFYCATGIYKGAPERLRELGLVDKNSFYANAIRLAFTDWKGFINKAIVTIDGEGGRDFIRQLQSYLKQCINDPGQHFIQKVSMGRSSGNNLLQLADMVAGSINRSLGKKDDHYREIIKKREKGVKEWPQ